MKTLRVVLSATLVAIGLSAQQQSSAPLNDQRIVDLMSMGRSGTLPAYTTRLTSHEVNEIIRQLLNTLRLAGLVEITQEGTSPDEVHGYRLPASAIVWVEGKGTKPFRDPIRVPGESEVGGRTNPFFVNFYRSMASELAGFEAREHTAQVPYEDRLIREDRFRKAELPVLYCSPTMELWPNACPVETWTKARLYDR